MPIMERYARTCIITATTMLPNATKTKEKRSFCYGKPSFILHAFLDMERGVTLYVWMKTKCTLSIKL